MTERTLNSIIKKAKEDKDLALHEILELGLPCPMQRKKGTIFYCASDPSHSCEYGAEFYIIVNKDGTIIDRKKCTYNSHIDYYDIALEIWKEGNGEE